MTSAPRLLALPLLLLLAGLCPATLRAQTPICGDNVLDVELRDGERRQDRQV